MTVAQGLEVFDTKVPSSLAGKRIIDSGLREATGCTIVGYRDQGGLPANPPATTVLEPGHELVLIGDLEARQAFLATYAEQA